jgi:hypothetical protein
MCIFQVKRLEIPASPTFSFNNFLADPGDVREWNIQGLPADAFSSENGVLVTRSNRWPLMIDPQVSFSEVCSLTDEIVKTRLVLLSNNHFNFNFCKSVADLLKAYPAVGWLLIMKQS